MRVCDPKRAVRRFFTCTFFNKKMPTRRPVHEQMLKYFMQKNLIFFLFLPVLMTAQPQENNPYSRFGLGNPATSTFTQQTGMGGLTAAWNDPHHFNPENPAAHAFLRTTAFETGLFAQRSNLKSPTASLTDWRGNLTHLALGFPLKSPINEVLDKVKSPWSYGMGLALTPYTTLGYTTEKGGTEPGIGTYKTAFSGTGGLYKFRWGTAVKYKNLSVGANLGYVFGKLNYESFTDVTSDSLSGFLTDYSNALNVRGFTYNVGSQYVHVLKKNLETGVPTEMLTFGIFGNTTHNVNASGESLVLRGRSRQTNGTISNADTLSITDVSGKKVKLPAELAVGFMYTKVNKLKIGAQYSLANWSKYENEAREKEVLKNAFTVSGGLEWIPSSKNYGSYAKKMRYRVGAFYKKDPRVIDGEQIDNLGLTVGLGMPVFLPRQGTSFINWSLEIGKLGRSTPISDSYFRLAVGFTMNDNSWFYKRRFE